MKNFFESELCDSSDDVCRKCRRAREYRRGIVASYDEPTDVDFDCPMGKTKEDYPQKVEASIFDMGKSFVQSMAREVKARASRPEEQKRVSKEEYERRLQICKDCEFFINNKRCAKCGCVMGWKARLQTGSCYIGKW